MGALIPTCHHAELYELCHRYRRSMGAPWFTKSYDLNMLIARSSLVGLWDDVGILAFTDDAQRKCVETFVVAADAWEGEWTNPTHPDGCLFTLDGHYPAGFRPGLHHNRPALRQSAPFDYVRWPRGMGHKPTLGELLARAKTHRFTDTRGTHWHDRVNNHTPVVPKTDDTEGCVASLYKHQHKMMLELVALQKALRGSDSVSPTFCQQEHLLSA